MRAVNIGQMTVKRIADVGRRILRQLAGPRRLLERPLNQVARHVREILGPDNPLIAVDIGGANDLQPHWSRLAAVAQFIVYEPHEESYKDLILRHSQNPEYANFRYLKEALSGGGGPRLLYQTNVPTGSSLIPPKKGGAGDHPRDTYFWPLTTKSIETATLAQSLDREGVARIDMIKLDTQGTELEILQGLDRQRLANALLVETECSILDVYEGGERVFEDMLHFMRENGMQLFDLRTNRFLGNSVRLDPAVLTNVLGDELNHPPLAHRLGEVDAIFVRDPLTLMKADASSATLRRLIAALIAYNFFPEAVFTVVEGQSRNLFTDAELERLLAAIAALKSLAAEDLKSTIAAVQQQRGLNWAQYMWVPYPSA